MPHHSDPNESAAPTPPVPAAAAPRATITLFFSGISLLTGTGACYRYPLATVNNVSTPLAAGLPCMVAITDRGYVG